MLAQLDRQFVQAGLAEARQLLEDSRLHDDVLAEHQYRARVAQLEREVAELDRSVEMSAAGVALFFGGRPVVGSHGIKAAFGTQAVGQFQKLVSQRYAAAELGPLSPRGRVPLSDDTQLLVTDVVRGSFGFVLQGMQAEHADTLLKQVVDEVADTLSRMAASDDAMFDEAAGMVDNRQLGTLQAFFKLLDDEGASLRIVEGQRDFELTAQAIQRARQRAESLVIDERTETVEGEIIGWAEYSSRFELRRHDDGCVVTGFVTREAMTHVGAGLANPLHSHVRALLKVREVRARSRATRKSFALQSMEAIEPPVGWQARPIQPPL